MLRRNEETQVGESQGKSVPPGSGVTPVQEFAPGSVVAGKYEVERVIGEGGLGVVVKARHVGLDQPVAIKHLKPLAASRTDVVERFMREARLAAKIKNEHAVKVHDVDAIESGIPYMVMEFLDGRDLGAMLLESPLPPTKAIDYVLQACEALAEAHAAGIVHRDLKPGNLFLASRPGGASIVKVVDFGISKITSKDTPSEKRVTRVDERVGTPVFMSPEQLQAAEDLDARADIWALGVVLYELVTGRVPFDAEDLPQLCVAILTQPPVPLTAVKPDAPPGLEEVIARCLQKDRTERYPNVAELARDLTAIWQGEPPSRVVSISRVVREGAGQQVSALLEVARQATEDQVVAVFTDAAGNVVDQMDFVSIDEAYEYTSALEGSAVRCDLYDAFAGVRGRLRVSYVRDPDTRQWVPLASP